MPLTPVCLSGLSDLPSGTSDLWQRPHVVHWVTCRLRNAFNSTCVAPNMFALALFCPHLSSLLRASQNINNPGAEALFLSLIVSGWVTGRLLLVWLDLFGLWIICPMRSCRPLRPERDSLQPAAFHCGFVFTRRYNFDRCLFLHGLFCIQTFFRVTLRADIFRFLSLTNFMVRVNKSCVLKAAARTPKSLKKGFIPPEIQKTPIKNLNVLHSGSMWV